MNKIGITGATGVLGKILCKKLTEKSVSFSVFKGDLRNKEDVGQWFSDDFDAIIHLAALVPTNAVKANPLQAFSVNVGGTINLLEQVTRADRKLWLFYASTSHIYASSTDPIEEDYIKKPISLYGKTKLMAEEVLIETASAESINFDFCIGRIFSFYHSTQQTPFLYPNIIKRLAEEDLSKDFELYGAESVRDFLNAEEVVDIILEMLGKKLCGIYNVASGKGTKIRDFVQSFTSTPLNIINKGATDYLVADTSKLDKALERHYE